MDENTKDSIITVIASYADDLTALIDHIRAGRLRDAEDVKDAMEDIGYKIGSTDVE